MPSPTNFYAVWHNRIDPQIRAAAAEGHSAAAPPLPGLPTAAMIAAGKNALHRLVAEDDLRNDPEWIVRDIWEAMREASVQDNAA